MCQEPIAPTLTILAALTAVLFSAPLLATDLELAPEPALCPVTPAQEAIPMAPCKDCPATQFSPRFGVVCSFTGTCQHGANACCEATCSCGGCNVPLGTPANACDLTLPTNCCPGPVACIRSYCDGFGVRCEACGCGAGCCRYKCGVPDPSCTGFDPIPPNAC